jgi:cytochrome c553
MRFLLNTLRLLTHVNAGATLALIVWMVCHGAACGADAGAHEARSPSKSSEAGECEECPS